MKNYLKLIRVKHWLKNGLVFLPIFFSLNILNKEMLLTSVLAFFIFSFTSSIVYVTNDIADIDKDKLHPIKKNRPLASGKVSIKEAKLIRGILLIVLGILLGIISKSIESIWVLLIPIIYLVMNIAYSKKLKDIPIIDVVVIVTGFILRVIYGGLVINVEVSKYLYLMIIFGSFYLAFGKRRNEIMKNGDKSRTSLTLYNKEFLDKNMYVAFSLAIVSYILWCIDPTTIEHIGNSYIFWTIPLLMVILQLYSLNIEGNSYGDPIDVILSDKKLIICIILYMISMITIIYVL
ncbi:MAG: UbiA prenyltransferase family protein [Bacilli bacterium]|nr:UbiA prenyltransferase family protein [Bacilli bacterium]